jgi:multidrug efflux pump subunit AcrB
MGEKNKSTKEKTSKQEKDNLLVKMTAFFFKNWKLTMLLWVLLLGFGVTTYTTLIPRAGFPPISFPLSFISGAYPGESKESIDIDVIKPLSEALASQEVVDVISATSNDGFFTAAITFDGDGIDSTSGSELVQKVINESGLPAGVIVNVVAVDPGSFLAEFDLVAQVYSTSGATVEQLDEVAGYVAGQLEDLPAVSAAEVKGNISTGEGDESVSVQTTFTRIGLSSEDDSDVAFYGASTVGVKKSSDVDILQLSEDIGQRLDSIDLSRFDGDFSTIVSADFASEITSQIDFLESNIFTGLLAVAFVSFLLISWRASIITGLFMVSVILTTIVVLYLIGYSLNVITLFGLILSLGLFVDDATIAVEAIDVNRRDKKMKPLDATKNAVRKVGMASLAGTLTTILVFAVLVTPTGILGEFIRLIPITVIIALTSSFILSMTLIPFLAKFFLLRNTKTSWITKVNPVLKLENWLGNKMSDIVQSIRTTKGKYIAALSLLFSFVVIASGVYLFGFKVDQNIFPPSKDTDEIGVQLQFVSSKSVEESSKLAEQVDQIVSDSIGEYVLSAFYGGESQANAQQATLLIDLIPFTDRETKAPVISGTLFAALESELPSEIKFNVVPVDNGPPASQFPFGIRVFSDDPLVLTAATQEIADAYVGSKLENFNGDIVTVTDSQIDGIGNQILRDTGERYAITRFSYDSANPTIVAALTEAEFDERVNAETLTELGIDIDAIAFDAGQEGDFEDSFNTLALAVPVAMVLMYLLLAIQFRSFMQPFLILLAIPFTLFGVASGLLATDNAASFFSLVGFIGLIGIAVNNTIMMTDYANQERKNGAGAIDAIAAAAQKRLRPLVTTTFTTVVALLPLALSDPFWEALAYTIIFGLISSTILVLLSFPYYYLGAEWLRMRVSKGTRKARKAKKKQK